MHLLLVKIWGREIHESFATVLLLTQSRLGRTSLPMRGIEKTTHIASAEEEGKRLDHALSSLAPGLGLRALRRIWERWEVLVDGAPRKKGHRIQAGQRIELRERPMEQQGAALRIEVVKETHEYIALYKPPGLDSAIIQGREGAPGRAPAEQQLREIFPGGGVCLLNRLDRPTSGLLLSAKNERAARAFQDYENQGRVEKRYYALVHGAVESPLTLKRALDTANRKKSKALKQETPDPLRWTKARPVKTINTEQGGRTLFDVRIKKGARHQIRAHLAEAGRPIVGDALYGEAEENSLLYLFHYRITFPGFDAEQRPEWKVCEQLEALS